MLNPTRLLVCTMVVSTALLIANAAPCAAQENNSFAVGVKFTNRLAADATVEAKDTIGIRWRLGHSESGWGWSWGLNWYTTHIDRRIGTSDVRFGKLRIRPFLAGYGYTHAITNRLAVKADVLGGVAFSSFDITPEADDAFHALPAQSIGITTGVTPVVKPEVGLWYDLGRRFGVSVDFGYIVARPRITVDTSIGRDSSRVRADAFLVGAGIVYRLF